MQRPHTVVGNKAQARTRYTPLWFRHAFYRAVALIAASSRVTICLRRPQRHTTRRVASEATFHLCSAILPFPCSSRGRWSGAVSNMSPRLPDSFAHHARKRSAHRCPLSVKRPQDPEDAKTSLHRLLGVAGTPACGTRRRYADATAPMLPQAPACTRRYRAGTALPLIRPAC